MSERQKKFNRKVVWFLVKLLIALPLSTEMHEKLGEDIKELSELM